MVALEREAFGLPVRVQPRLAQAARDSFENSACRSSVKPPKARRRPPKRCWPNWPSRTSRAAQGADAVPLLSKLKSTYTDRLARADQPAHRAHPYVVSKAVAATGRLSSTDPEPAEHSDRTLKAGAFCQRLSRLKATSCWRRTTRKSNCASWRTWPRTKVCWTPSATAVTYKGHRRGGLRRAAG